MTDSLPIPLLPAWDDHTPFPPPEKALRHPNGLLAVGGSLRPQRLLQAYRQGAFPWYASGEPVLWWCPDPRCVIFPDRLHISRRLRRRIRQAPFRISRNEAFREVITGCRAPRNYTSDTWILPEIVEAFARMHELGHAVSWECWHEHTLVGGIYGLQIGQVLFGESMFSHSRDASKIALAHLAASPGIALIDCQIANPHLLRMGANLIPRERFLELLDELGAGSQSPS